MWATVCQWSGECAGTVSIHSRQQKNSYLFYVHNTRHVISTLDAINQSSQTSFNRRHQQTASTLHYCQPMLCRVVMSLAPAMWRWSSVVTKHFITIEDLCTITPRHSTLLYPVNNSPRLMYNSHLTLWRPLLPYGYSYKGSILCQTGLSRQL